MVAWQIDPSKMLSCTASIDEKVVTTGKQKDEIGKMTGDEIEKAIQNLRKIRMQEFVNGLFLKYISQLVIHENLNTENMIRFKGTLENGSQKAIQQSS